MNRGVKSIIHYHCSPVNCQRHESDTFINDHHPHGRFFAPRQLLLDNRSSVTAPALPYYRTSCTYALPYYRPWWSAAGVEPPWIAKSGEKFV